MLHIYFPLLLLLVLGLAFGGGAVLVSSLFGKRERTALKGLPYESGMDIKEDARNTFAVKFNITTLVFLVFDVEIAFLFPWAVLLKDGLQQGQAAFLLLEMGVFLFVLAFALVYAIARKGIAWD